MEPRDDQLRDFNAPSASSSAGHTASLESSKEELLDSIEVFYNQERMHSSLDYASPAGFERAAHLEKAAA